MMDLTGERFGRWTVIERAEPRGARRRLAWLCRCDCGTVRAVGAESLRGGTGKSCGCLQRQRAAESNAARATHGHSRNSKSSPTFYSFMTMRTRCLNPNSDHYPHYGGRGIAICDRWQGRAGFANFLADMGERPAGKTLDRIDVNGNYEPGNCRWATPAEQSRNKRTVKLNEEKVAEIRASNEPRAVLAARFGVTVVFIDRVRRGIVWKPLRAA